MGSSSKTIDPALPGSLDILGVPWVVEMDESLQDNHNEWGVTQLKERRILLDPSGDLPTVMIHELAHVVIEQLRTDLRDDEQVAQHFSLGLRAVFHDNPDFLVWYTWAVSNP